MIGHGNFPFGRKNSARPPRRPSGAADLFVLGVYPSALHVRWNAPAGKGAPVRIGALAVDNEPVCFWDGADEEKRIARWKKAVEFPPDGGWGTVGPTAGNGSSGELVVREVLSPLKVSPDKAWFTDAIPWYFVKTGARQQGSAITERYGPFAKSRGLPPTELPERPKARELVDLAVRSQAVRIRREILESEAGLVVTLGQEAWDTLVGVANNPKPPGDRLTSLAYGKRGTIEIDGRKLEWLPLAHPGIVRQSKAWREAHQAWSFKP